MKLHFVNVGYGDAFLLENGGENCLIDTGSGLSQEYEGFPERIRIEDFLQGKGIRHIHHLILSHIHEDHVGNLLSLLEKTEIGKLWIPAGLERIRGDSGFCAERTYRKNSTRLFHKALDDFAKALQVCAQKGIALAVLEQGAAPEIAGIPMRVLGAKKENMDLFLRCYEEVLACVQRNSSPEAVLERMDAFSNYTSLLLKLQCRKASILLCADNIPDNWEEDIQPYLADVNVIKLPHHAQADAVNERFMKDLPLAYCITTASSDCRYNSADETVYARLRSWAGEEAERIRFLFTDPAKACLYQAERGYQAIRMEFGEEITCFFEKMH